MSERGVEEGVEAAVSLMRLNFEVKEARVNGTNLSANAAEYYGDHLFRHSREGGNLVNYEILEGLIFLLDSRLRGNDDL